MQRAAEAAVARAADEPAVAHAHGDRARTALAGRKPKRGGAYGRTSHHCQHDAARALHGLPPFDLRDDRKRAPIRQDERGDFAAARVTKKIGGDPNN
jgi:hypothetical protein